MFLLSNGIKKSIFFNIPSKVGLISVATIIGLSGCGGTGQDEGSPSGFTQQFSGLVIDGYLARTTVFIDSNNNGTRDAWEARAFTDNDGYYSYNPITDTDYCAENASAEQAQYCLVANIEYSEVVIRVDSGYDVTTGEPFLGQMSRRVNASVEEDVNDSIISPITSLLTSVDTEAERSTLLTSLGIGEDDLDVDYFNTDGVGSVNAPLLNTALKIHKVVAVLSDRLTDTYDEIGEDFGTPNDASSAVYPNLAEQIISSGASLDVALSNETTLVSALDAAESSLREVYERKEFDLPADMGSVSSPDAFERVVEVASEFSAVVNTLIDVNDTDFSQSDATGSVRALESLVIKTVNERSNISDASIENAINFLNGDETTTLLGTLLASLSLDSADVNALSLNDFSGADFDSAEEISEAASLAEGVSPFDRVGGMQLKVSDLDLGDRPTNSDDSEVELYFNGEVGDVDGSFQACVKHIDGADETAGTLGEGNTRGELVEGFWSLLGAREGDVESFSLLITLTFLGTTYQAIMKPAGMETIDNIEYRRIRFDNDGELNVWHSEDGFTEITTIPSTNEACQERLPTRINV